MEDEDKRITAYLIPYKIIDGVFFFYMQKRSENTKRHPCWFSIFRGGVEKWESSEKAMLREIKEELNFVPYLYRGVGHSKEKLILS